MKKLLALVLALVMTLSLCVTSNAAFADAADIEHDEAVEVMNALGVINGKGDNKFDPKGNVTRAEMAKMISIIMLGEVDVSAFVGTATDLKDVAGHWAEGYIKYCYSQGVIAGKGNGMFDPNANVTASEAAKMLLVAIGYNAKVQGYEGAEWAINVARDAQLSGFYAELKALTSGKVLTRDEAAQMIWNAVQANTITKTPTITVGTNEVSYTYYANGDPLLKETFSAKEYVGVLKTITYASSSKKYTYGAGDTFKNQANLIDVHGGNGFITTADYTDLKGEEVSIIAVTAKNGDETILSVAATGKTTVVESAVSKIEAVTGSTTKLKINGTEYDTETITAATYVDANSYDTVKLTDTDNNGKLDYAVVTTVTPVKVVYVSSTEIIAGNTYKFADNDIAEGLAKDDYVAIVKDTYTGKSTITKVEAVEGKVTADKTSKNLVQVNDTWYCDENQALTLGSTYKFYAVNDVVIAGSQTVLNGNNITNLVMVYNHDTGVINAQAAIIDATGTKKTVAISEDNATALTDGALYIYEETDNGYKFTAAATSDDGKYTWAAGATGDVAATNNKIDKLDSQEISDTAVIFVFGASDKSATVITGKQLKSLDIAGNTTTDGKICSDNTGRGVFTSTVSGLTRVSYAAVATSKVSKLGATNGNEVYAYVTAASYEVKLGTTTYVTYSIWNGTENVTVFEKGNTARAKGAILCYDAIDADGKITGVSALTITNADTGDVTSTKETVSIQGMEGKYLYLDGVASGNKAEKTTDTVYLYVDTSASDAADVGIAAGEVVLADKYTTSNIFMDNAVAVVNASDELVLLVVDVKNNYTSSVNKTLDVTNTAGATKVTLSVSGTDAAKKGDAIVVTCVTAGTYTFTNAKLADGTGSKAMTVGEKVTIFADGVGDVVVS